MNSRILREGSKEWSQLGVVTTNSGGREGRHRTRLPPPFLFHGSAHRSRSSFRRGTSYITVLLVTATGHAGVQFCLDGVGLRGCARGGRAVCTVCSEGKCELEVRNEDCVACAKDKTCFPH